MGGAHSRVQWSHHRKTPLSACVLVGPAKSPDCSRVWSSAQSQRSIHCDEAPTLPCAACLCPVLSKCFQGPARPSWSTLGCQGWWSLLLCCAQEASGFASSTGTTVFVRGCSNQGTCGPRKSRTPCYGWDVLMAMEVNQQNMPPSFLTVS